MNLGLQQRCSMAHAARTRNDEYFKVTDTNTWIGTIFQADDVRLIASGLRVRWGFECPACLTGRLGFHFPTQGHSPNEASFHQTYGGHAVIKGWRFSEFWSGNGLSHVFTVAKSYRRYGKRFMGVLSCCVIRRAVQGTLAILVSSRYGALTEQNITALNLDDDFTIFTVNMKACWG